MGNCISTPEVPRLSPKIGKTRVLDIRNWITQELYCLISNNFIILLRLASPVWVGRANYIQRRYLTFIFCHQTSQTWYSKKIRQRGRPYRWWRFSHCAFDVEFTAYHPWRGLATLLILWVGSEGLMTGWAEVKLPRLFLYPFVWGDCEH